MQLENFERGREEYQRKYGKLKDYISSQKIKDTTEITKFDSSDFDLTKLQARLADQAEKEKFEENIIGSTDIVQQINHDFNVIVYGIGSKIELLEKAMKELMESNPQSYFFVLKGFKPLVNMKMFLQKIGETLKINSNVKNSEQIIKQIENTPHSIIIIGHSIDGRHLLNEQAQKLLGQLSNCPNVRMACSFDNYRYPMICKIQRAFFQCVHTNKPYVQEILQIFEDQVGKQKQEEGLWYVLSSMTQKQKNIVYYFAGKVLESRDGLNFQDLYDVLSEEMIVSSKIQLKENLKELMDHKIIIEKGGKYTMQYSNTILQELCSKFDEVIKQ
ncbi:unnamed protein product [Paramecium sonneborni]|uniref:Origin recognition complex subunit 2 n=1 Tax=Paramecium sonneborni TaxID=65129 RepID=A0A8S1RIS3_9CILI|nr:unnamed protein product [Paramecium sonneborni]